MGTVATITSGTTTMATAATELNKIITSQNTVAQYSRTTTLTINSTTPIAVGLDSNDFQQGSLTHSTSTNNDRLTVSDAGVYRFTAQLQCGHLTTGTAPLIAYFRRNGTTEIANSAARWSANGVTSDTGVLVVDVMISMAAADYVQLMVASTVANEWSLVATNSSGTSPNIIPVTPAVILTAVDYPA